MNKREYLVTFKQFILSYAILISFRDSGFAFQYSVLAYL